MISTDLGPREFLILMVIPVGSLVLFIQSIRQVRGHLKSKEESEKTPSFDEMPQI
jgi:hypothetical protein